MNSETVDSSQSQAIEDEIVELEERLEKAKARLNKAQVNQGPSTPPATIPSGDGTGLHVYSDSLPTLTVPLTSSAHHFLLLLSDSALPLGSFAFSSGLESYLAHTRPRSSFPAFLNLSLSSYASITLPFVLAAHRHPIDLLELDDALDAAIVCTVGRRASVAQGRALLSIWDRSFRSALPAGASAAAVEVLKEFTVLLRATSSNITTDLPTASAHLGPMFGAIAVILGMSLRQTAYVFMLSHVKALLSAAVRASIFGPYHAQKMLASVEVQEGIQKVIEREWETKIEDAGQSVPVMDLWIGRHEMLYSRIFNS
jgi:urease accessory protein